MLRIDIPERPPLKLDRLVLDLNGTLCVGGALVSGVAERLDILARTLTLHAITADTRGQAVKVLAGLPLTIDILPPGNQDKAKRDFARSLNAQTVAAVGNGANDRLMLAEAALGVALIQAEGACVQAVQAADVVCLNIRDALALLIEPQRLIATLRN